MKSFSLSDTLSDASGSLLVPQWPVPAGVQAFFSTRKGGCSQGAYASLNLGTHVGDDPLAVERNRAVLSERLGCEPVFLQQVHGWEHVALQPATPHNTVADVCSSVLPVSQGGRACSIMVADCLPLLMCNTQGTWVGAAHAGWRGLLGGAEGVGAIEALVMAARQAGAGELMAWIGPCISPHAFEVGAEVRQAFMQQLPAGVAAADIEMAFKPAPMAAGVQAGQLPGKWMGNLPLLARQRLLAQGVSHIYGNDGSLDWCTVTQTDWFFSHRRDGTSGRQAALIWLS